MVKASLTEISVKGALDKHYKPVCDIDEAAAWPLSQLFHILGPTSSPQPESPTSPDFLRAFLRTSGYRPNPHLPVPRSTPCRRRCPTWTTRGTRTTTTTGSTMSRQFFQSQVSQRRSTSQWCVSTSMIRGHHVAVCLVKLRNRKIGKTCWLDLIWSKSLCQWKFLDLVSSPCHVGNPSSH